MNKTGFTLIEVLVVVLIIGILTSIALPQYQKAVMRSYFSQMLQINNAIYNAQIIFHDTYNKYADTIDELDITLPKSSNITCQANYYKATLCVLYKPGGKIFAAIAQQYTDGRRRCYAYIDPYPAAYLCEQEMNNTSFASDCNGNCHVYWEK